MQQKRRVGKKETIIALWACRVYGSDCLIYIYYDVVCAVRTICINILTGHLLLKEHVNVTQGP